MTDVSQMLVLRLDEQRYALGLQVVERVIRASAITPLPGAPAGVVGALQAQGQVVPVFDMRHRFGLPSRSLRLSDQIVLAHTSRRLVGVCVDVADEVLSYPVDLIVDAQQLVEGAHYVTGVVKLPDGLLLIHDLDTFLSSDEAQQLDAALGQTS
ncbi:MAG: chemotaxis protein CheW [Rhodocyclales bacterium]|nr:chemotaxis protein CheW [Rhodocyclales bacterium]